MQGRADAFFFFFNNLHAALVRSEMKTGEQTWDKRQRRDSMWFLATESPMKAIVFPLTISRNPLGSNRESSHFSGFHRQFRKSLSGRPCRKQFLESGIVLQLEFVYGDPRRSGTHRPSYRSQSSCISSDRIQKKKKGIKKTRDDQGRSNDGEPEDFEGEGYPFESRGLWNRERAVEGQGSRGWRGWGSSRGEGRRRGKEAEHPSWRSKACPFWCREVYLGKQRRASCFISEAGGRRIKRPYGIWWASTSRRTWRLKG